MDWQTLITWLKVPAVALGMGRTDRADHGDMGTAFGLDASMGADACAEFDDMPAPENRRWDHRLTRRSSL